MSDNQHGAYYSVRTPNGHLFSSSRATQEEVFADLAAAFGEEYADAVKADIKSMAITYGKESMGVVIPLPAQADVEAQAVAAIGGAFDATISDPQDAEVTTTVGQTTPQFDSCNKCNSPKSKWVPAGVSKRTGKPYPGFFGCSNSSCR